MTESIKCPKGHNVYQNHDYEFLIDNRYFDAEVFICRICYRPYFGAELISTTSNSEVVENEQPSNPPKLDNKGWINFDKQKPKFGQYIKTNKNLEGLYVGTSDPDKMQVELGVIINEEEGASYYFNKWKPADKLTVEAPKVDNHGCIS